MATVFASVHFQIIISDRLTASRAAEISTVLESNGGTAHSPSAAVATAELDSLTHIITETSKFDGCIQTENRMIAIVNASWVDTSISKKRLANPKSHSPDPRMFFSGLIICTAGLEEGDKDAIIGGVLAMGGLYSGSLSRLVTHVVAMDLEHVACQTALTKGFECEIVRPQWFDDCLRLGKRINEKPYLLSNIGSQGEGKSRAVEQDNLQGALLLGVNGSPSISHSSSHDNILNGKKVVLAGDLAIKEHLRETLVTLVVAAGGAVCDVVEDCDVFVGHFREGHGYREAYKGEKIIGNLPWLYWMLAHNRWTYPSQHLLHYPIPYDGFPGTKSLRLCLSNYSGEARIYLESLAKAAGCEFTKTLKCDNTHLITAHTRSEKCDAAREWDIHLVNHLWLEESYARCQVQSPRNPRYTHFPPHTNLTEIVGQTPIDRDAVDRQFRGQELTPSSGEQVSSSAEKMAVSTPPTKALSQRSKAHHIDRKRKEPLAKRLSGKENDIPALTSSDRSAKTKATERLHAFGEDFLLYEKERKRVGGVVYGGRKSDVAGAERKRSLSDANLTDNDKETPSKRGRPPITPLQMRVLVTGLPEYSGPDKKSIRLRDHLRSLGILITESESNCRYLVAPRILRTRKFLCAIAQAPMVLRPDFLRACLENNGIVEPTDYTILDAAGEQQYSVDLKEALTLAISHRGRMLHGWTIWVTAHIAKGYESYVDIVEANGGKCLPFQGRSGSILQGTQSSDIDSDGTVSEPAYLISGPSETEQACWEKFRQMTRDAGREPRIVQRQWLLDAALRQEVRWSSEYVQNGDLEEDLD